MLFRFHKCNALYMRLCLLISIVLVLSGCGKVVGTSPPPKPTTEKTPSKVTPTPDPSRVSFQIENLLYVYGSVAVGCKPTFAFSTRSLALATDRLTYDQAEINQISAFIDSQGFIDKDIGPIDGPPIPKSLEYITGSASLMSVWGSSTPKEERDFTFCGTTLEVTNVSKETLQIPQVNLHYVSSAGPNTQLYRLINVCSVGIRTQKNCPPAIGGPTGNYGVGFTIGMGPANTTYSDKPTQIMNDSPLTLRPGGAAYIDLSFSVKTYEGGLFVSTMPEIVVASPDKTQTFALDQFRMDIAIAASQNVSCYALKGNTFVQQDPTIGQCV